MTDPKKPKDEAPDEALPETEADGTSAEAQDDTVDRDDTTAGSASETESGATDGEKTADPSAEADDADTGPDGGDNSTSDPDTKDADSTEDYESGSDDGEPPLSEEQQREIAEAALRDAEMGYSGDGYPAENPAENTRDTIAAATAAAAGGAAAAGAAAGTGAASSKSGTSAQSPVVVERRGGGFVPGLIGGVIAVAGAVFAAPYVLPESMRPVMSLAPVEAGLEAQSGEISGVATSLEALAGRVDAAESALAEAVQPDAIAALDERLATLQTELTAQNENLGARIDALAMDFANFERSPLEDSADPAIVAALAAYAREVQTLRDEVTAQTEENTRVIEEAAAATAEARALAEAEQATAAERAAIAARQQALVDIKSALGSGAPFAEALEAFGGEAPEALSAVAGQGVATLASLQASFTDPARAALAAARRTDVGDAPAERGLSFLQTQLGMRSLAPRDGNSADAILSRAEAATRSGDLTTAVSELNALPEAALSEMQDWIARATTRVDAVAAADALAQSLATN